jgi:endonuclease YncB( thermonuclease family)
MNPSRFVLFFAFLVFSTSAFGQQTLTGEVTEVFDGGTFSMTASRANFKVRLQHIDPPLPEQPLHETVKSHLTNLIKGKTVTVNLQSITQGFSIGRVHLGDVDVSMQMLRDGAAWYSVPEAPSHSQEERTKYLEMEGLAKGEKRGVWAVASVRPAWEIRIEREKAEKERQEAEFKAAAEKFARSGLPSAPALGMSPGEVRFICGYDRGDFISITDTADGKDVFMILYATTIARAEKMCFGSFSFTNGKLARIKRDNR